MIIISEVPNTNPAIKCLVDKNKSQDRWENTPHQVVEHIKPYLVYGIKHEEASSRTHVFIVTCSVVS